MAKPTVVLAAVCLGLQLGKSRLHEIIFSSSGLYGAAHIPMALLANAAGGLELRHLPIAGAGPALTALLGNNAHIFVAPVSASLTYIKSEQVRPLATLGGSRVPSLPDVPTVKELGYAIEYYVWVGLFAPIPTTSFHIYGTLCDGRHTRISSRARSRTWGWIWPISISRNSSSFGTRTPRGSKQPFDRSVECNDQTAHAGLGVADLLEVMRS